MGKKTKIGKQRKDRFYHLAKETGYRSRAAFKLIQLNRKFEFLQKSKVLIDLCAAPGGWLQVAQKYMPVSSIIIGVDLAPIKPIHNVITFQEDITTQKCRSLLNKELKTWKVDVVLNDGAPNVGKSWIHDAFEQNRLTLSALQLASEFLMKGGWFVTKVFRSKDYNSLMWVFKKLFQRVHATKPQASRNESAEIFVVCQNYIAPDKIDDKFFDPSYVFADLKPKEQKMTKADLLKPASKNNKKPKAEGYEDGELLLFQKVNSSDFMQSPNYIDLLSKANEIILDSEDIKKHHSTTNEIVECIKDLKVLGRKELASLINWRKAVREDLFKREREIGENVQEEIEIGQEEEDNEDGDPEENEEAQKLKRKKRKIAKEKKKIEERLNLKMIIKDDQLVQEEQDLFSLKNIRKASQINAIKDVDPDHYDYEIDSDSDSNTKKRKVSFDKDSAQKYYDPDDSDDVISDDDDDQNETNDLDMTVDSDNDDDGDNGILVDLEDKNDKVSNLTKHFFENKIFRHTLDPSAGDLSNGNDLTADDDIELEELENRISNTKSGLNNVNSKRVKIETNEKPAKVTFADGKFDDSSDSEDEQEETQVKPTRGQMLSPEEMALGAMMIKSNKAKRDLLDHGWNRYVHEDDDMLPSWFRKEENVYYRKPAPVSNEMVKEYNDKLREINSKPIKKVMEAKARKKKRALRRLEKARIKAESVTDEADMTNKEKAQYIRSIYKKALRKNQDKVQLVVGKKQYGNRRPPGVKGRYKVVDSRLKKDKRNQPTNAKGRKGSKGKPSKPHGKGQSKGHAKGKGKGRK